MEHRAGKHEVLPEAGHQVSFRVAGQERLRWHPGEDYPRPYFYPLRGPSGESLTRMGHPGAPNHDHHQSIWFAHHRVLGIDFWANGGTPRIRQQEWLAYQDDPEGAIMAVRLAWFDGHDPRELLQQELIVAARDAGEGETLVELQSTFVPTAESLEFGKTNFGFLAVRVAKHISAHFGGGQLTNDAGVVGEPALFGKRSAWMDYSGSTTSWIGGEPHAVAEGITFFDHPANPRFPTPWHVRSDGWMGAAVCLEESLLTTRASPLSLRYLLHAHRGGANQERSREIATSFHGQRPFQVSRTQRPHQMYEVTRQS